MTRTTTIALALLTLAACNKEPKVKAENATVAEVAAKVQQSGAGKDMRFEPGEWKVVSEAKLVEATGMPAGVADKMREAMQHSSTETQCLTPEQAARPSSDMFAGKQNSTCKYDKFEMGGGVIKAELHCPGGAGSQMAMTMDGRYTPTSYTMDAAMNMQAPGSGQGMKMAVHSVGTRVGECTGAAEGK